MGRDNSSEVGTGRITLSQKRRPDNRSTPRGGAPRWAGWWRRRAAGTRSPSLL